MTYQNLEKYAGNSGNNVARGTFNSDSGSGGSSSFAGTKFSTDLVEVFDLTAKNAGCTGYSGGCFDGKYVYICNAVSTTGKLIRYNTSLPFSDAASYDYYDVSAGISVNYQGFTGCIFDGRYVYYTPFTNGSYDGWVLRYDTWGSFTSSGSYTGLNLASFTTLTGYADFIGFYPGSFDGRYLYMLSNMNNSVVRTGKLLRFDTNNSLGFTNVASWSVFDLAGINSLYVGNSGMCIIGNYLYIIPFYNNSGSQGNIIRYDITKTFTSSDSYEVYNLATIDASYVGFFGGTTNGTDLFITQLYQGGNFKSKLLKYDTSKPFSTATSWTSLDLEAINGNCIGLNGACFTGKDLILAPFGANGATQGTIVKIDTLKPYDASAVSILDINALSTNYRGYRGQVFDGKYVYFVPYVSGSGVNSSYFTRIKVKPY